MADTNFSLIDLKALSEPACKLIDAVKDAAGILYEPTRIKRKARADVDAAIIKLEGEAELQEVALRAAERIKRRELRRQENIESIISGALQELPEAVSDAPVNEDWITQFFDNCQDVRDDEMQSLWSKLLAGEVAKPRTYSLRTLNTVKLLRKEDAALFTQFCDYIWDGDTAGWLGYISTHYTNELLKSKGISVVELLHLQTLGLIAAESTFLVTKKDPVTATYFGRTYRFVFEPPKELEGLSMANLPTFLLTNTGKELAPLCGAQADETYLSLLIERPAPLIKLEEVKVNRE